MNENYKQFYQKGRTAYLVSRSGEVVSTTEPEAEHPKFRVIATYNGKGYRRVRLQGKTFKVHRLVADAFLPNPDNLPFVLHIDGNRENNVYTNLMWSGKQSNHSLASEERASPPTPLPWARGETVNSKQ